MVVCDWPERNLNYRHPQYDGEYPCHFRGIFRASAPEAAGCAAAPEYLAAPLAPAALAVTAGTLLDRHASLPMPVSLIAAAACLLAWFCMRGSPHRGLPLVYLALAGVAFGAAYHHYRRDVYAPDDIALHAKDEPAPVQLRGFLDEEPVRNRAPADDPLRSLGAAAPP